MDSHADGINGSGSALAPASRSAGCIWVYGWACLVRSEGLFSSSSVIKTELALKLLESYVSRVWLEILLQYKLPN